MKDKSTYTNSKRINVVPMTNTMINKTMIRAYFLGNLLIRKEQLSVSLNEKNKKNTFVAIPFRIKKVSL